MTTQTMRFNRGEIVRAAYSTQGLKASHKYVVDEVVVEPSAFGTFVTYYVQDAKRTGKRFRITNGHLVLELVKAAPVGNTAPLKGFRVQPAKEDIANALQILSGLSSGIGGRD